MLLIFRPVSMDETSKILAVFEVPNRDDYTILWNLQFQSRLGEALARMQNTGRIFKIGFKEIAFRGEYHELPEG